MSMSVSAPAPANAPTPASAPAPGTPPTPGTPAPSASAPGAPAPGVQDPNVCMAPPAPGTPPGPVPPGTAAANQATTLPPQGSERAQQDQNEQQIRADAQRQNDELNARANGQPPPNPRDVTREPDGTITEYQRDPAGNVTGTRSTRSSGPDSYTVSQASYGPGNQINYQSTQVTPDQTQLRATNWDNKGPPPASSSELQQRAILANQTDPAQITTSKTFQHTGANLSVRDTAEGPAGYQESTSSYSRQPDATGVHGNLQDQFHPGPVDVVCTTTSGHGPNGEPVQPQTTTTYAQDGVRATSIDTKTDQGQDKPREWALEKQTAPNQTKEQDFVEGNQSYQKVTTRTARGSSVDEQTHEQAEDPNTHAMHSVDTTQTSHYDDAGTVDSRHSDALDDQGKRTITDTQRTQRQTPQGLEIDEHTTGVQTAPNQPEIRTDATLTSRQTDHGMEFVHGTQDVSTPTDHAHAEIDPSKPQPYSLTLNGNPVNGAQGLNQDQQLLLGVAHQGLSSELQRFSAGASGAPDASTNAARVGSMASSVLGIPPKVMDLANKEAGEALNGFSEEAIDSAKNPGRLTGIGASALGLVNSTLNTVQDVRDGNYRKAVQDGLSGASSASGMGAGTADALEQALKNSARPAAAGIAAGFSKFLGPLGAAAGLGSSIMDMVHNSDSHDPYTKASSALGLASAVVGAGAAAVDILAATGVGALAGSEVPVAGNIIGAVVGLGCGITSWALSRYDQTDIPATVI